MEIGFIVPVLNNFTGFAQLINSIDVPVKPIILDNWNGNRGVAASWNQGIDRGKDCDVLIICNDDVAFWPGTIEKLIEGLKYGYDLISVVATDTGRTGYLLTEKPDFCCFAIKPSFVDKFGYFDENFKIGYFEDNDMYYRVKTAGGRTALKLDARVDHGGSVTQFKGSRDPDTNDRVVSHHRFELNRDYFVSKWGGFPGSEKYTTPFNRGGSIKDW